MSLSQLLFATAYDLLNSAVEGRVTPYRRETAGRTRGDVLEIGAGTGANLPFYPREVRLTVVEPNPHMVGRLTRKAAKLGREIRVLKDHGESLPFPGASFDGVVTTLVLCMVGDLDRVLSETRRILKPGGIFYFYEHVISEDPRGRQWQHRLNPAWRFVTTGCNLDRDIGGAIRKAGFASTELKKFDLKVAPLLTIPNIVGIARA